MVPHNILLMDEGIYIPNHASNVGGVRKRELHLQLCLLMYIVLKLYLFSLLIADDFARLNMVLENDNARMLCRYGVMV